MIGVQRLLAQAETETAPGTQDSAAGIETTLFVSCR